MPTRLFIILNLLFLAAALGLNAQAQSSAQSTFDWIGDNYSPFGKPEKVFAAPTVRKPKSDNNLLSTTVIVTPGNPQGFSTADTRPGGSVSFTADANTPGGIAALHLTTDATTAAKAQFLRAENTPLASVTELSYYTKQISSSFADGVPSYQFQVWLDGTAGTFTNFVYEPYNNGFSITNNVWQQWDVDAGQFWSSRNVNAGGACVVTAGAGGPPFYTLAQIKANCPNAVVVGFGVNVGTFNPSYDVETDLVNFNATTYDFELNPVTRIVDDNGAQCPTATFTTIQAAVNAANAGDIIQVCAGNYPEYVSTNKNLTFLGPQAGVDARSGRTNPANEAVVGTVNGAFNLQLTPGTTTVDGFTLSGATAVADTPALLLLGGAGHQIVNNIIAGNSRGSYFNSPNTTFKHNLLNNTGDGIFGGVDNTTIEENLFTGGHADGAVNSTVSTGDPQPDNYKLINNVSTASGNFAVIFATNNAQITGNVVTNASFSAIFIGGGNSNLLIANNSVTGGASNAVSFSGGFGYPADSGITIRSNTLNNNLRGINLGAAANSTTGIEVYFNRIVGNSAAGINNASLASVNAENNWWGCNYGAGATGAGCSGATNGVTGTVDANPWLTLTSSASPNSVITGGTSAVTSKVTINSDGADTAASGTIPNGTPSAFTATLGTVLPTSGTTTSGVTNTTFTAGASAGTGGAGTTIDGQTVTAPIAVAFTCNNVSIPTGITTLRNNPVTVPLNVDDVTDRNILSFDYRVTYNASVLSYVGTTQTGTLSNGMTITVNSLTPGTLVVSGFTPNPLAGSGTLINLNFFAIGAIGTTSPVNFSAFAFNEGSPCVNTANGSVNIISGSLSGVVTYANAPSYTQVPYTTLSAVGSVNASTQTDLTGAYLLDGLGSGAYTVTPSKTGDVNGITSFDSALIAQHVVGLITLNSTQLLAADVSANNAVTSFDAALISQYIVLIPNPGITGTWKFVPASRSYPNVEADLVGQDYSAILMGEVSGNWVPPTMFGAVVKDASPVKEAVSPQAVAVTAPALTVAPNAVFNVPITVTDTTGQGIISYQFDMVYNPAIITPDPSPCDTSGTISSAMFPVCNTTSPGLLKVSVFGAVPISGAGTLLKLKFSAVGANNSNSVLDIQNFLFNEDPLLLSGAADGSVHILAPTAANVEVSGQLMTFGGEPVKNAIVILTDSSGTERTVRSNSFGNYRFTDIPVGAIYTIGVKAKGLNFTPQVLSVNDVVSNLILIADSQ